MASVLWVIMTVGLVCVVVAQKSDRMNAQRMQGYRRMCRLEGRLFNEGQVVVSRSAPCLKYICRNGHMELLRAACAYKGNCHNVGAVWKDLDCHTYTCRRLSYQYFSVERLQSGCKDAYERCHNSGDIFPYKRYGHVVHGCTCRTTPEIIDYSCP